MHQLILSTTFLLYLTIFKIKAYPEHGLSVSLQDDQGNFPRNQYKPVSGWAAKSSVQYILGVRFDGTAITVTKPGIYYLSFHFILKSADETTSIALIINNNIDFLPLSSDQRKASSDMSAATFLKLVAEDKIDVRIKTTNKGLRICKGSALFFRFHNYGTSSLGFYFALKKNINVRVNNNEVTKDLGKWIKRDERQFYATTAFRQGAESFKIPKSGIYIILANIVVLNLVNKQYSVKLNLICDSKILAFDFITFHDFANSFTLRLHQSVYLKTESNIKLQVVTNGTINVLPVSTWSAILASDGSADSLSFRYELGNHQDITVIDEFPNPVSNWIKIVSNEANFGDPDILVQKKSFNARIPNFFYVSTHVIVEIIFNKTENYLYNFTVALGNQNAFGSSYAEKMIIIDKITYMTSNNLSVFQRSIGVCGVFQLRVTTPLSVLVHAPFAKQIRILKNSSFSVVKVPEYYPGFYSNTEKQNGKITKNYTSVNLWTLNNIGNYDFTNNFGKNTGIYKVPTDGMYLITANVIVNEINDQIYVLISVNGNLNFERGIYSLEKNPPLPATINIAGLFDLKANDNVELLLKTNSDEDWKILSAGLSACYLGINPTSVQSKLSEEITTPHGTTPHALTGWKGNSDNYRIQVSGVYFMYANIIFKYVSVRTKFFKIYAVKNNNTIPGLKSIRSRQNEQRQQNTQFTLFFSGTFIAEKYDVIQIYAEHSSGTHEIVTQSLWGLVLLSTRNFISGTSAVLLSSNNFNVPERWKTPGKFYFRESGINGLYRQGDINTDEDNFVQIMKQGIYLVSANIEIIQSQYPDKPIKVALVINEENGFENGLLVQQKSKWHTITLHIVGALLLNKGDKVAVKIYRGRTGVIEIEKNLGFSVVAVPEPLLPTAFAAAWKESMKIIPDEKNLTGFVFNDELSSQNIDWSNGLIDIVNDGFYVLVAELLFENPGSLIENLTISIMINDGTYKTFPSHFIEYESRISIFETLNLKYGDTVQLQIHLYYNKTLLDNLFAEYIELNKSRDTNMDLTNPRDLLYILLKEGSTFSLKYLKDSQVRNSVKMVSDQSINTNGELNRISNGWFNSDIPGSDASKYHVTKDGAYLLVFSYYLFGIFETVEIAFTKDNNIICSTQHACVNYCEINFKLTCLAVLRESENIEISIKVVGNSVTLAKDSVQNIHFIRSNPSGFKVVLRDTITVETKDTDWLNLGDWSSNIVGHPEFLKDVTLIRNQLLLRKAGTYYITAAVQIKRKRTINNKSHINLRRRRSLSNNETNVYLNGSMSNHTVNGTNFTTTTPMNATTTVPPIIRLPITFHVCIDANQVCDSSFMRIQDMSENADAMTINIIGIGKFDKWTLLNLKIKHNSSLEDFEILNGTYISSVLTEDVPFSRVEDPGPIMPSSELVPSNYSTSDVGIEKNWTCQAFGDGEVVYKWYKNYQEILTQRTSTGVLTINGEISDSGEYFCKVSVGGFDFESKSIHVNIYDIDECELGEHDCSRNGYCTNNNGSYDCTCLDGYHGDGRFCENINECNSTTNVCMNNSICIDLVPGYNCSCVLGYQGNDPKNQPCIDFDECESNMTNICHPRFGNCINNDGSYSCQCKHGFSGNGVNCTDIDECEFANDFCPQRSSCTNQVGNYTCECNQGYQLNGTTCQDIDECTVGNTTELCPNENNVCVNTDGSYACACKTGYTGSPFDCQDVNECEKGGRDLCSIKGDCYNEIGSYRCQCKEGFTGDGKECSDVDECAIGPVCGNGTCTNSLGRYDCDCDEGYIFQDKTCRERTEGTSSAQTDACSVDPNSFKCVCNDPNKRKNNILCNGLFVALIILVLVAFVVLLFVIKYIKSRKLMKIRPAKVHKDKYIEMENESEL